MVARFVGPSPDGSDDWSKVLARRLEAQRQAMLSATRLRQPGDPMYQPSALTGAGSGTGSAITPMTPADQLRAAKLGSQTALQDGQPGASARAAQAAGINAEKNPTVGGAGAMAAGANAITGEGATVGAGASGDVHGSAEGGSAVIGDPAQLMPSDSGYNTPGGLPGPVVGNDEWLTDRYPNASLVGLAEDPNRWATAWAMSQGYGPGVTNLLNTYIDPAAAFLLSLGSGTDPNDPVAKLSYGGGVFEHGLQKYDGSGSMGWEGPTEVINAILGSSGTNPEGSPLGRMLYGGANAGNWGNQVRDTITFMQQALIGRMSPEVMQPYLQNLTLYGERFMEYKAMNPTDTRNFGAWLLDTLGPNAGL